MDIHLEALEHRYPSGVLALDRVDLTIEGGSSVALIGANGSGKTTLVRHLDGLLRPTGGRVMLDAQDVATMRVAQVAALVAVGFQDPERQIFERSVRAEVSFGPRQLRWTGERQQRAVERALRAAGLAGSADSHPGDLTAAQRKLLTIAAVLAMETPIVVLDEPTTNLDAQGLGRMRVALDEVLGEGRTVILISHDLDIVAETCGRVVVLERGRIVLDGDPTEVFHERHRPSLERSGLVLPAAARMGAALGLGSTPTEAAFLGALRGRRVQRADEGA